MSPHIFRIVQHDGAWAIEHNGHYSNHSSDKAEVLAIASRLARAAAGGDGRPSQVRVEGETGYS